MRKLSVNRKLRTLQCLRKLVNNQAEIIELLQEKIALLEEDLKACDEAIAMSNKKHTTSC